MIENCFQLLERESHSGRYPDVLVRFVARETFSVLVDESLNALMALEQPGAVFGDENTIKRVRELKNPPEDRITLVTPLARLGVSNMPNPIPLDFVREGGVSGRYIAILSEDLSLVAALQYIPGPHVAAMGEATGLWTTYRPLVSETMHALAEAGNVSPPPFDPTDCKQLRASSFTHRLMAAVGRSYEERGRGLVAAQSDLSTVLDILKTLSEHRGAHDILFEFVERIATTVGIDRCSIVRVWAGDDVGHVLASHEDERIRDLPIDLDKYPEILTAIEKRRLVRIPDAWSDPVTVPFKDALQGAKIRALLVVPIILDNERVGSFLLRAARESGAFSEREVNFCEIVARTAANALERADLFERIQHANQRLEYLAVTDGLTGLYNQRYFRARLEEEVARAQRYDTPLACILIDADNFKRINDTYGHLQGDSVLKELAQRIQKAVRKNDIAARYGGEEFAVLLPQTELAGARTQANRLLERVRRDPYPSLPEDDRVSVSIGLAMLTPDVASVDGLIQKADEALYEAKTGGKDRLVIAP